MRNGPMCQWVDKVCCSRRLIQCPRLHQINLIGREEDGASDGQSETQQPFCNAATHSALEFRSTPENCGRRYPRMGLIAYFSRRVFGEPKALASRVFHTRPRLEPDRQPRRAMNPQRLPRLPRLVTRQLKPMNPLQKIAQRDAGLQACQRRTQAGVDAMPKRDVRIGPAADIKSTRVVELLRITVRRANQRQD